MSRQQVRRTTIGMLAAGVLLVVATSPLWTIVLVKRQAAQIVDDSLQGLMNSSLANLNISDGFVELALAISTNDPAERAKIVAEIETVSQSTDEKLRAYSLSVNSPIEQGKYDQLVQQRQMYRETRAQVLALLNEGKAAEALALYRHTGLQRFVEYKDAADQVVQYNADEARNRGREILRLCNYLLVLQAVLLIFFFVYAFFVPMVTIFEQVTTRGDLVRDL